MPSGIVRSIGFMIRSSMNAARRRKLRRRRERRRDQAIIERTGGIVAPAHIFPHRPHRQLRRSRRRRFRAIETRQEPPASRRTGTVAFPHVAPDATAADSTAQHKLAGPQPSGGAIRAGNAGYDEAGNVMLALWLGLRPGPRVSQVFCNIFHRRLCFCYAMVPRRGFRALKARVRK